MKMTQVRKTLLTTLAIAFITCGVIYAGIIIHGYRQGQREYSELADRYTSYSIRPADDDLPVQNTEQDSTLKAEQVYRTEINRDAVGDEKTDNVLPADAPEMLNVDFDSLRKENKDVIGWINIPAIDISYPVLQADDNEYYLHRDLHGNYLFAGSIFVDSSCSSTFADYNTILYGHNMRDGSMFAGLRKFQDEKTLQKCRYFWICTPREKLLYEIYSIHTASVGSDTYRVRFNNYEEYASWLQGMRSLSIPEMEVETEGVEKIVTLSTCTENTSIRKVVQGKMVWMEKT